jgi:amidase
MIRVPASRHVFALSVDAPPATRVRAGETFVLETADCFAGQVGAGADLTRLDWELINPATGPVFVEGARPGDVLAVRIDRLEVADEGVMAVSDEFGVLADRIEHLEFRAVPIMDGAARLAPAVSVPIAPMIGVIGTAPQAGAVPTGTPGRHGGNMDTRLIAEGAVVYLPVFHEGALLAAGDLHAAMGDGEICGTGVEVAGAVTLTASVRGDLALGWPLVETADAVATIASADTLDAAADEATRSMVDLLAQRLRLSTVDATLLMSAAGQLQVSQVVDPLRTARFCLPKSAVAGLGALL